MLPPDGQTDNTTDTERLTSAAVLEMPAYALCHPPLRLSEPLDRPDQGHDVRLDVAGTGHAQVTINNMPPDHIRSKSDDDTTWHLPTTSRRTSCRKCIAVERLVLHRNAALPPVPRLRFEWQCRHRTCLSQCPTAYPRAPSVHARASTVAPASSDRMHCLE